MILALSLVVALQNPVDETTLIERTHHWFESMTQAGGDAQMLASIALQQSVKEFPLEELTVWEQALIDGRIYPSMPKAKFEKTHGKQTDIEIGWCAPHDSHPTTSMPVLLVLSASENTPSVCRQAQAQFGNEALILAPKLAGLTFQKENFDSWRFRVLDALGFAFRNFNVDRNRVNLLVADSELEEVAKYLRRVLPHFFCSWNPAVESSSGDSKTLAEMIVARNPFPLAFTAEFIESGAGRYFWIQAQRFLPAYQGQVNAKLNVRVDKASNTIHLDGRGVDRIDIFLNNQIIDLSKEIVLVRNGMRTVCRAQPSLRTLLENYMINLDAQALFPAMIRQVDIPVAQQ